MPAVWSVLIDANLHFIIKKFLWMYVAWFNRLGYTTTFSQRKVRKSVQWFLGVDGNWKHLSGRLQINGRFRYFTALGNKSGLG